MKRFWTIFAVALVALGVTACSEGADEQTAPATEGVSFYASVNMGADSRATLEKDDEGVWNTVWEGNETLIANINWTNKFEFSNTPEEPNKFTCTDPSILDLMVDGPVSANIYNKNAENGPNSAMGADGISIWSTCMLGSGDPVVLEADCAILRYSSDYEVTFTTTATYFPNGGLFGDGTMEGYDVKNFSELTLPAGKDILVPIFHKDLAGSGSLSYAIDGKTCGTISNFSPKNGTIYNLGTLDKPFVAEKSEWGVVGELTGWTDNGDIAMYTTPTANLFVAKNITITEAQVYTGFKIRNKGNWTGLNYGRRYYDYIMSNHWTSAWVNSSDLYFTEAGSFDIYFQQINNDEAKIWLMKAGVDYTTAAEQTKEGPMPDPSGMTWGLCGEHNGWGSNDTALTWDGSLGMYVAKNISLTGEFKVRADKSWTNNYGGATISLNKAAATTIYNNSSGNLKLSGTTTNKLYDVYLWVDSSNLKNPAKIWVKTPGSAAPSL